jgi:uncharacterized damage-inducible protein DinB
MQDDVVNLFAYDRWANLRMLDACRRLTAAEYVAEPVVGWSSVRATVYHIAWVTELHVRKVAGVPDDGLPSEGDLATFSAAAFTRSRSSARTCTEP